MDMGDVFVSDTHGDCVLSLLTVSLILLLSGFLVVPFEFSCKSSLTV